MTTAEKIFVQIFERKNWIIEWAKQQTELYSQHLASKHLIDGITPPPWLWNTNRASNPREAKEELISKLIGSYPDFGEGIINRKELAVQALNRKDYGGCALNDISKRESTFSSAVDWSDESILKNYNALDHSPARIQRSRSRQRVLELHSSERPDKSGSSIGNMRNGVASKNRCSLSGHQTDKNADPTNVADSYINGSQCCEDLNLGEAEQQAQVKAMGAYPCRITRARSHGECPVFVRDSLTSGCSSEDCKDNPLLHASKGRRSGSNPVSDSEHGDSCVNQLPVSCRLSTIYCQSFGGRKEDNGTSCFTGVDAGPKIYMKRQSWAHGFSRSDSSFDHDQSMDITMIGSEDANLPPDYIDGSLVCVGPNVLIEGCVVPESLSEDYKTSGEKEILPSWSSTPCNYCAEVCALEIPLHSAQANVCAVAPSSKRSAQQVDDSNETLRSEKPSGLFCKMTRSHIPSTNTEAYNAVNSDDISCLEVILSKPDCKQKFERDELKENTSSSQAMPFYYGTYDVLDDKHEKASFVISNDVSLPDQVVQLGRSSSYEEKQQLESIIARAPSDSFVIVELEQINSKEIEECNLKAIISNSEHETLTNSPKKMINFPSGENSLPGKRSRHSMKSWPPQLNRGKLEYKETPISRERRCRSIQMVPTQENMKNEETNFDTVLMDTFTVDIDQCMPLFEGSATDSLDGSGALEFAANGIQFDKVDLPRNAVERVNVLVEICRSASLDAPLSHLSTTFKFPEGRTLLESVPNADIYHLDFESTSPSNFDVAKQLHSVVTPADCNQDSLEQMPYSNYIAYSGAPYGPNLRNQQTSPIEKLWECLSSHTRRSESRLISNPELTCFRIEEEPGCEVNQSAVECVDDAHEELYSSSANSDKRKPFRNTIDLDSNPHMVSQENPLRVDSRDFVSAKLTVTGTQENFQFNDGSLTSKQQTSCIGSTDDGRIRKTSSIGSYAIKKAKPSINNSTKKSIVSNKLSLKRQNQKFSLKEINIITLNSSSSIPLMEKQEAGAVFGGKRDVKVKALRAAKAAKRLEEKREYERKMRNEALKLKRAKLEEKNLRDKEEEQKKKRLI